METARLYTDTAYLDGWWSVIEGKQPPAHTHRALARAAVRGRRAALADIGTAMMGGY